jgi:CubicO group peptidase (beta-lactamase class C family)
LDDPVARYLPVFETPGGGPFSRCDVTIRHLASHSSGLVWDEGDDAFNGDSVAVEQLRAATKPGEVLHYSAIGMHVLEKTVEAATGEDLERLIVDRILTPLELHETRYVYRYSKTLPLLPSHVEGPVVRQDDYKFMQRGDRASAGLYMTARDLNRWCRLWLHSGTLDGHTLFSPELQREAWTFHSLRESDQGRSGLLWWLYEDDGAYMTSGLSRTLSVVYPRTGIVLTVARNQIGPFVGAFDYAVDKKRLVALASRFGPD